MRRKVLCDRSARFEAACAELRTIICGTTNSTARYGYDLGRNRHKTFRHYFEKQLLRGAFEA